MNIKQMVLDIFREEFENQTLEISETTSSSNITNWDSLANINLVVAMEKEFGIRFTTQEVKALQNVGGMIKLIESKLAK